MQTHAESFTRGGITADPPSFHFRTWLLALVLLPSSSARAQAPACVALIPKPRELACVGALKATSVSVDAPATGDDAFAAQDLRDALKERGFRVATSGSVTIALRRANQPTAQRLLARAKWTLDSAMREEGYVIVSDSAGRRITVIGATAAGVFYGAQTAKQLFDHGRVTLARVRDWPAMRYRGVHDDLSRGPVPTLEFQKKQIRTFAAYKLNVYSPYFEHTLQYASHPIVAPPGGSMSREDVKELVAYAARYHIDVIPEQEAFGHLHHMLKWELYDSLGETKRGHVLAPGQPGSLQVMRDMFAEIDSLFPSRYVHLGADETFELGRGQTAERVKSEGLGAVYLGFLKDVESALRPYGKKLLFWGDIAMNSPDLVKTLPKDLVAVAWDYAPRQNWDRWLTPYRDAGMEIWVAPGVNNWQRVYPDYNSLLNIQGFIRDGQKFGAVGVLNTTWDDDGDAIFNETWYGILFGAAASWQPGESSIPEFQDAYGRVFHGDTTGKVDAAQKKAIEATALLRNARLGTTNFAFWIDPFAPDGQRVSAQVLPVASQVRIAAESALVLTTQARRAAPLRENDALDAMELGFRRLDFLAAKFQFADDIVQGYARATAASHDTIAASRETVSRELSDAAGVNGRAADLRDGYANLRQLYERAWLAENRPYWIENVLARFDLNTQLWITRLDAIAAVRRDWGRTRTLPSSAALGIPTPAPPTPTP